MNNPIDVADVANNVDPDPTATHYIKLARAQVLINQNKADLKNSATKDTPEHATKVMINDLATEILTKMNPKTPI